MRHIKDFSGGPKWVSLGGGQKVYVEKGYVLWLGAPKEGGLRRGQLRKFHLTRFSRFP